MHRPQDYILSFFSTFFKNFEYADSIRLAKSLIPRYYTKSEELFEIGSVSNGIYLILKGEVTFSMSTDKITPILSYKQGCFFGENFIIDSKVENSVQVASKNMQCLFIPKEQVNRILAEKKEYMNKLKNIAIFKKAVVALEEIKFNDKIAVIIKKMKDIKQEDEQKQDLEKKKFKQQKRSFLKDKVFKHLVQTAIVTTNKTAEEGEKKEAPKVYYDSQIEDYINKLHPEKSMNNLNVLDNAINKFVSLKKVAETYANLNLI